MVFGKLCSDISLDMQHKEFVYVSLSMKAEARVTTARRICLTGICLTGICMTGICLTEICLTEICYSSMLKLLVQLTEVLTASDAEFRQDGAASCADGSYHV